MAGTTGNKSDITERKQAEEELRSAKILLDKTFASLTAAVFVVDVSTRTINTCNKAAETMFGYTADEMVGHNIRFLHVDERMYQQFGEMVRKALESAGEFNTEFELRRKDGTVFLTENTITVIEDESGQSTQFVSVVRDITERKQAEKALKASEARLTGILNIAPEAVVTVGADMNIQIFNQGAERIFGYKADEVLGQPLEMLIPSRLRDGHGKHIDEFDRSPETYRLMGQRREIAGLKKDGTEFPASASVSKLEIDGEKIFTVMLRDITEQKQADDALVAAKEEAETASRAKSEFLAAMSHDLRTPLNAILGFADILRGQYFGPIDDKYREYADDIHSSGEHLLELVNDILDLSTIEAGKQALVREKLAIEEVIAECAKIISEKARFYGIDLITKVPKNLPSLYADRRATKQILLNLLSNAVKFTPEGGKVTLSAKGLKGKTVFMVADSGKGIPAEELPGLTDPFTRGERDPYVAEKGWGLGLTITKSLVDLHDGTLDIKSKVGKGTTVTVTLPNEAP
ncbi:MAG: PAS domain-containing sensor histidine kinase [Proteobacteria bacterium]|nr:PAS domain-containing sensor histidine kinase [Pseudomonadota bacterium]